MQSQPRCKDAYLATTYAVLTVSKALVSSKYQRRTGRSACAGIHHRARMIFNVASASKRSKVRCSRSGSVNESALTDFYILAKKCVYLGACDSVTVWGASDGPSWVPRMSGQNCQWMIRSGSVNTYCTCVP